MKKWILLLISVFMTVQSFAQFLYKNEPAFKSGEVGIYNIYYNLGFIWIHAGDVRFSVKSTTVKGEPGFYLELAGYTMKSFDRFYCIRDTFTVEVTQDDLMPSNYREVKHEDSYFCDRKYHFDQEFSSKVFWVFNRKGVISSDSLKIDNTVFDLLTTCYRFRSLDMSHISNGEILPFNMLFDTSVYNLGMTYRGKETIKLRNGAKYKALKFTPKLITGDLFKNEDDMTIYVSDDDNHVPLYIEAKIKVGSVKVMLESVKNNKYPLSSSILKK